LRVRRRNRPRPGRRDPARGRSAGPPPPQPDQALEDAAHLPPATAADSLTAVRVLVVTNFTPDASAPQRGRRGLDQVDEVRRRGLDPALFVSERGRRGYLPATRRLRSLLRRERFDLVHAHYGLAGWVARLAGARPLLVTFHGTDVRHPVVGSLSRRLAWQADLSSAVSRALFFEEDGRPGLPPLPRSPVPPSRPSPPPPPPPPPRAPPPPPARPLPPPPRRSRAPGEAPRPRRRARPRRRRPAPHRRLDRARGDGDLDERRERRRRHLRLRGLRHG